MKSLEKLQNDTLIQMVQSEDMLSCFAKGLQNAITTIGLTTLVAAGVLSSSMAHADTTLKSMLGVSAIGGILSNGKGVSDANQIPGCNIQGYNGWKIGGAAAIGSYAGNNIGDGRGRTVATIIGGMGAAGLAGVSDQQRIDRETAECVRRLQQAQMQQATYAQNYGQMPPNYAAPRNAQPIGEMPILYVFRSHQNGQINTVTPMNSPGIQALIGKTQPTRELNSDPNVFDIVQRSTRDLEKSYQDLQNSSAYYMNLIQQAQPDGYGRPRNPSITKDDFDKAIVKWDHDYTEYTRMRAFNVAVFDNAALEGYNIRGYKEVINYYDPPANANQPCQCVLPNRYSGVPDKLVSHR